MNNKRNRKDATNMLMYRGKIDGIKKREYQGRTRAHLQFVMSNEAGELAFVEVRVPDSMADRFSVGQQIEAPLTYSVVNGEVYFKIDEKAANEIKVGKAA